VIEIRGASGTGKTSLLLSLAANYIASTSFSCFDISCKDEEESNHCFGSSLHSTSPPPVVILDSEHDVHIPNVAVAVRHAVLRRWNETTLIRKNMSSKQQQVPEEEDEWKLIDAEIQQSLGRIHIIQPRDYTTGFIPTLESLRFSLDQAAADTTKEDIARPPLMVLMNSLSTFDALDQMYESLPTTTSSSTSVINDKKFKQSGLSSQNEFYRQLSRLYYSHDVILVGTTRQSSSSSSSASTPTKKMMKKKNGWSDLVTHTLLLEKVIPGTREDMDGIDFVALVPLEEGGDSGGGGTVVPFLITSGGIHC